MSDSNSSSSGGVGLCTVLFLIFLVLKLTGHITWSWWWVTAPLWIPLSIVFAAVLGIGGIALASCITLFCIEMYKNRKGN